MSVFRQRKCCVINVNKKILVLINYDSGLYCFRKEVLEALVAAQNEVYCSFPFGNETDKIKALGCECIDIKISRRGTNPVEDVKLFLNYIRLVRKIKPDVVLTYTIKPNIYGGMACRLLKVPYIANVTGLGSAVQNGGLMQKLTLMLYKFGLKKAKMVFFQNAENQQFMLKNRVVKGQHDLLPGSGVNLVQHCFEEYPENDEQVVLLTIGRIMFDKGSNEILKAAKIVKDEYPNVIFRFIGSTDGSCSEQLIQAVSEGVVEHIENQPQVHSFIKESHATLHASYHEGMSNVLLETAASGRPVIATKVAGCRETFDEGISGIGFEAKNVDDLVRAIKEFLGLTNEQRAQMGLAGRKKMENEFDRQIIVQKYIEILEKL